MEERNNVNNESANNINESEKKLKNEIYVFYSKEKPGIKFYDKTPDRKVQDSIKTYPDGMYVTDRNSIVENVEWNNEKNDPTKDKGIISSDGETVFTTHMVSLPQFQKIEKNIIRTEMDKKVIIDTRDMTKMVNHVDIAYLDKDVRISNEEIDNAEYVIKEMLKGKNFSDEER